MASRLCVLAALLVSSGGQAASAPLQPTDAPGKPIKSTYVATVTWAIVDR
jgi:hypothetical protein